MAAFTFQGAAVRRTLRTVIRIFSCGACVRRVLVGHYCRWDLNKCSKVCAESGTEQYLRGIRPLDSGLATLNISILFFSSNWNFI